MSPHADSCSARPLPQYRSAQWHDSRHGHQPILDLLVSGPAACHRLTSTQFSVGEITAIVEEAEACGTYVCAHAYTPPSISRAVRCGVRSIEHGNWLDEECAALMAEKGVSQHWWCWWCWCCWCCLVVPCGVVVCGDPGRLASWCSAAAVHACCIAMRWRARAMCSIVMTHGRCAC
jgi:hypothetical protein